MRKEFIYQENQKFLCYTKKSNLKKMEVQYSRRLGSGKAARPALAEKISSDLFRVWMLTTKSSGIKVDLRNCVSKFCGLPLKNICYVPQDWLLHLNYNQFIEMFTICGPCNNLDYLNKIG
ncbi:MAG: hypothetical protein ACPLN0_06695 [Candidatus Hydrothermia bacterium]